MDFDSIKRLEIDVLNHAPIQQIRNSIIYFNNLLNDITEEDEDILKDYITTINNIDYKLSDQETKNMVSKLKMNVYKVYVRLLVNQIYDIDTYDYIINSNRYLNYGFYKDLKIKASLRMCRVYLEDDYKLSKNKINEIEKLAENFKVFKNEYNEVLNACSFYKGKFSYYGMRRYPRSLSLAKKELSKCYGEFKELAEIILKEIDEELERKRKEQEQEILRLKEIKRQQELVRLANEKIRLEKLEIERKEKEKREAERKERERILQEEYRRKLELLEQQERVRKIEAESKERERLTNNLKNYIAKYSKINFREKTSIPYEYQKLKRLMGNHDKFFHITEFRNAISVVKNKCLLSREYANKLNFMKYDNIKHIETTAGVMSNNRSTRIEKYVRFYFNPLNDATYTFKKKYEANNTFGVAFTIDFSLLYRLTDEKIILSPGNAHDLEDDDFSWYRYNVTNKNNLHNLKLDNFSFNHTYMSYSKDLDSYIKNYQKAEVLIFEKVALPCISNIIFATYYEREKFREHLTDEEWDSIKDICIINSFVLWR